ncbi:competence protein ComK [Sporolactobacillus laevolacticus]|uniref:competence protein ComK n=1 Tax=Sporolactobacillus laevolacticus TaxID=33018 RepID=UPI0025B61165|nr:competence protein ComK [Sporolactobacillus laevolacticus]MDN3956607.1 competence protein ComK [Sporolactobacillus laevolacticus]
MELLQNYIIRPVTMALLPYEFADGTLGTMVIEESGELYVKQMPKKIIDESCGYYGSTYHGRKKGAMAMGYKSMPPICVCSELGIFFLPSMTEKSENCVWLAHSHIRQWMESGKKSDTVYVYLTHKQKIELPMSLRPFSGRVMKATQYRYQLRERISPYQMLDTDIPKKKKEPRKIIFNERGTFFIQPDAFEDAEA